MLPRQTGHLRQRTNDNEDFTCGRSVRGTENRRNSTALPTIGHNNEKGFTVQEQEVNWTPSRKSILKSPSRINLILAISAALLLAIGSVLSWIWHQRPAAFSYTSVAPIDPSALPGHWVATWAAAQQPQSLDLALPESFYQNNTLTNITIRQTMLMSIGGDRIRLRFSNAFATTPLRIEAVTIALPDPEHGGNRTSGAARVRLDTLAQLSFSGARGVTIPPHGLAVSDVVDFKIGTQEVITVSMFFSGQISDALAIHRISRTTSWFARGDQTASYTLRGGPADLETDSTPEWYVVSAVEAWQSIDYHAVAMVGDSITDGRSATLNANHRYPDFLFDRLQNTSDVELKTLSVVNLGIGGNQLLQDGTGPNLISRLDRDVLAVSGVKYAMVLEGTNDIGHARGTLEDQTRHIDDGIVQLQQVITRLHAAGIATFGGTVLPFACTEGIDPNNHANDPLKEQLRLKMNNWIRNSGAFDAVVDFDMWLRDPNNHTEMALKFRSGDCEHPSDAGFQEMAAKFPLDLFTRFKDGVQDYP